jgi:hypothetical protein
MHQVEAELADQGDEIQQVSPSAPIVAEPITITPCSGDSGGGLAPISAHGRR